MKTFEQVEIGLPNGFHDACIISVKLDLPGDSIEFEMDILVGQPDTPNPDSRRFGVLVVRSPYLFFAELPDVGRKLSVAGEALNVQGDKVSPGQNPDVDRVVLGISSNATIYRFFVEEWNSFLYIAGADVHFKWTDDANART